MRQMVFVAVAALTLSSCGYNRIQTLDEQAESFKKYQSQRNG